jgi:hypothetical protein
LTAQLSRPGRVACLDDIYNGQRLHSALNYLPPLAFEARLLAAPHFLPAAGAAPADCTALRQPTARSFGRSGREVRQRAFAGLAVLAAHQDVGKIPVGDQCQGA